MPAEQAQMRLMTASPITLRACIPAPDQVTPEQAYFKDLNFYKKTLFHTSFLSRGRAVTLLEYRDAKIVFEVDDWFKLLPQAVQRYLLPLQSMYAKWYDQNVRERTQNYSYCTLCKNKQTNLQRHHMQHHRAHRQRRSTQPQKLSRRPLHLPRNRGGVGAVAHGAHPRKLPQEWGRAAKRELLNSRDATPHRHRLPTLVGLHLPMLRKVSRSSPESSSCVTSRETYTRNYNVCFLQLRKKKSFKHLQWLD